MNSAKKFEVQKAVLCQDYFATVTMSWVWIEGNGIVFFSIYCYSNIIF